MALVHRVDSRPLEEAFEWRLIGREWAILGERERSEWAHGIADYLELPFWRRLFTATPSLEPPARSQPQ